MLPTAVPGRYVRGMGIATLLAERRRTVNQPEKVSEKKWDKVSWQSVLTLRQR